MRTICLSAACLSAALVLTACGSGDSTADDPVIATPTSAAATQAPPGAATTSPPAATATTVAPVGTVVTVAYAGGKVSGDTGRTKVKVGAPVTLRFTSDSAQQVHIHGVDLTFDVQPGVPVEKTFSQAAPGIYEIELHPSDFVLARLVVS